MAWNHLGTKLAIGTHDNYNPRYGYTYDGELLIYDVTTGERDLDLQQADGVRTIAWSPLGTKVATGCADGVARILDAESGEKVATISPGGKIAFPAAGGSAS